MIHSNLIEAEKTSIRKGIGANNIEVLKNMRSIVSDQLHKAIYKLINTEILVHAAFYNGKIDEDTYNKTIAQLDQYRAELNDSSYQIQEMVDIRTIDQETYSKIMFNCDITKDLIKGDNLH